MEVLAEAKVAKESLKAKEDLLDVKEDLVVRSSVAVVRASSSSAPPKLFLVAVGSVILSILSSSLSSLSL